MLLAAAALLGVHLAPTYTLKPIFVGDGLTLECWGLSDKSQLICNVQLETGPNEPNTNPERAFVWSDGKLTEITAPKEEDPEVRVSVSGFALNNGGTVLGTVTRYLRNNTQLGGRDFRWDAKRGINKLMVDDQPFSASSINNKGDILGVIGISSDPSRPWTFGVMTAKDGFVPYFPIDFADQLKPEFLNDKDMIAGVQLDAQRAEIGFRILPRSTQLETLAMPLQTGPDKPIGGVTAINNNGWMVGSVNMNPNGYRVQGNALAAVWSPENTFYSIGAGYLALDINDNGQVVGATRHTPTNHDSAAYVYDTENGIRFLDSLVPNGSPHLTRADAINNKGDILCESQSGWFLLKRNDKQ